MKRNPEIFFITGTDTGAGKTVFAALVAGYLRQRGVRVAAFKPVCSGGRDDAVALHQALAGTMTLDEINPWHFRAAVAPLLAARRERKSVRLAMVTRHIRAVRGDFDVAVVEGAGGLLSPLGEGFNSRDLIQALDATPVIVAPNKLGVVNQILLTLEALPEPFCRRAKIVLMSPRTPDTATATNAALLEEFCAKRKIFILPWLTPVSSQATTAATRRTLAALLGMIPQKSA